jgi:hypothetical protein
VGVLFFRRQPGTTSNGLEQPEELSAIKPPSLLAGEQVVGAIFRSQPQPFPESPVLVRIRQSNRICSSA